MKVISAKFLLTPKNSNVFKVDDGVYTSINIDKIKPDDIVQFNYEFQITQTPKKVKMHNPGLQLLGVFTGSIAFKTTGEKFLALNDEIEIEFEV